MTRLGHELMLCGPDDQDLIKGYAPEKSQIYLMNELMNLVETLSSEMSDKRLERSSNELNIRKMMKEQKTMLLKFFRLHRSQKITASKSSSLPTEPHYGKTEHLYAKPLEAKKTKGEELNEKLNKITETLQEHKGKVLSRQNSAQKRFLPYVIRHTIQDSLHHGNMFSQSSCNLGHTFCLTLLDSHELVIVFIHIYDDELHKQCNHLAPTINLCGPFFHCVHENLTICNQNVKTVSKVVNLKVEGDKTFLTGTRCVVVLQSLFPKSVTKKTTSVGMPSLESE